MPSCTWSSRRATIGCTEEANGRANASIRWTLLAPKQRWAGIIQGYRLSSGVSSRRNGQQAYLWVCWWISTPRQIGFWIPLAKHARAASTRSSSSLLWTLCTSHLLRSRLLPPAHSYNSMRTLLTFFALLTPLSSCLSLQEPSTIESILLCQFRTLCSMIHRFIE